MNLIDKILKEGDFFKPKKVDQREKEKAEKKKQYLLKIKEELGKVTKKYPNINFIRIIEVVHLVTYYTTWEIIQHILYGSEWNESDQGVIELSDRRFLISIDNFENMILNSDYLEEIFEELHEELGISRGSISRFSKDVKKVFSEIRSKGYNYFFVDLADEEYYDQEDLENENF